MKDKNKARFREVFDFIKTLLLALIFVVFIRLFIMSPFSVKGSSMEPSFYEDEYLIVDEISYRFFWNNLIGTINMRVQEC